MQTLCGSVFCLFLVFCSSHGFQGRILFRDDELRDGSKCVSKLGNGICMAINQCPKSQTSLDPNDICLFSGRTPIVCCSYELRPSTDNTTTTNVLHSPRVTEIGPESQNISSQETTQAPIRESTTTTTSNTEPVTVEIIKETTDTNRTSFAEKYCDEIYKEGSELSENIGQYGHITAIGWNTSNFIDWRCTGSLISRTFILTAAHCVNSSIQPDFVRTGTVDLLSMFPLLSEEQFPVKRVVVHPDYNATANQNDIALIELSGPSSFSNGVAPICLWTSADIPTNSSSEWEYHYENKQLKPTYLTSLENDECQKTFVENHIPERTISDNQICAHVPNKTEDCQNETGGPLQIRSNSSFVERNYLIGVSSIARFCSGTEVGVFSRVSSFIGWIESIVWMNNDIL